jgi:hypothetical protein
VTIQGASATVLEPVFRQGIPREPPSITSVSPDTTKRSQFRLSHAHYSYITTASRGRFTPKGRQPEGAKSRKHLEPGELQHGTRVIGIVSAAVAPHLLLWLFGFDNRIFFESAKDFRAGLENKDMFSRHQRAQEYLKKAKETHQEIVVRIAVCFVHDEILSLLPCPAATYHVPVLAEFGYFKPTQDRI